MDEERPEVTALEKARLRARFRSYRQTLSMAEYERRSGLVVATVTALPDLRSARRVHVYWPMLEAREIDTRPLIGWFEDRGVEIILPVVASFRRDEPALRHIRYPGAEGLRKNRWGIAEPSGEETVDVASLDAVIVPTLGAGRDGHRIGHGRGYYDVFLAGVDGLCIALTYQACLVDRVPSEPHDIPMDIVATEHEAVRPGSTQPAV